MSKRLKVLRCLEMCPDGLTDRQIASTLQITDKSATMHRVALMKSGQVKWSGRAVSTTYEKAGRVIDGPPAKMWVAVPLTIEGRQEVLAEGTRR